MEFQLDCRKLEIHEEGVITLIVAVSGEYYKSILTLNGWTPQEVLLNHNKSVPMITHMVSICSP